MKYRAYYVDLDDMTVTGMGDYPDRTKDCEFQTDGICRFVSIYDYQSSVRVAIARGDL